MRRSGLAIALTSRAGGCRLSLCEIRPLVAALSRSHGRDTGGWLLLTRGAIIRAGLRYPRPPVPEVVREHSHPHRRMTRAELDALIEEATVDCYNDEEQITGLFTMIDEQLAVPFRTEVLGAQVTVAKVDLTVEHEIVAVCRREHRKQAILVLDLRLPHPAPDGAQWIEAYRRWRR